MSNAFHDMSDHLRARAGEFLDGAQADWLSLSVQLAPVDDGDLQASGAMVEGGGEFERRIAFTAAHAKPQEFGSAAHVIMPKDAKALAFGGGVYARVDHPGNEAQPFARPAKQALRAPLKRDARKLFGK